MITKKRLAIELSKLHVFENPNVKLEQYPTDSELAAEMLWMAFMSGDINGKTVADLGCGTGILGIGALHLGASKVIFVDKDEAPLEILRKNIRDFENYEIITADIGQIQFRTDTVIENPPFGVKSKHADREFLLRAFNTAGCIYSIHKIESKSFIQKIAAEHGFRLQNFFEYDFPLKNTLSFHKSRIKRIKVGVWNLVMS